ncbi:hypothetical protein [Litorivivens sp.]|uniref:hypothetical protein n=1 Tax=Litorivivens sp. TaxID=2020868 RepID=UPI0035636AD9
MGNIHKALTAIAVASAVLLSGCSKAFDDDSPRPGPTAPPALAPITSSINVVLVDVDDDPIPGDTTVLVRDTSGAATGDALRLAPVGSTTSATSFTAKNGILALGLADGSPTFSADPLDVIFVGSKDGYFRSSNLVNIDKDGDTIVVIKMTKNDLADPAKAISTTKVTATSDASGAVSAPIAAKTPVDTTKSKAKGTTSLAVPSGTKLTTESGAPVTGNLTVNVAYFENDVNTGGSTPPTNSSLNTFPGGLDTSISDVDASGNTIPDQAISFSSAGFTSIEIRDDAGNLVKKFDKPITIDITVPEGTAAPDPAFDTNNNGVVDVGEKVPVWTYNELTGKWEREKIPAGEPGAGQPASVTLTDTTPGDGLLNGQFKTDHLSYFNLDFRGNRCSVQGSDPRTMTASVVDSSGVPNQRRFKFAGYQNGGGWSRLKTTYDSNTTQLILANNPTFKTTIELIGDDNSSMIDRFVTASGATITANNGKLNVGAGPDGIRGNADDMTLCDLHAGTVHLNKANPAASELVTLNFEIVQQCQQDNSVRTAYPTKSYVFRRGFMGIVSTEANGKGTIGNLDPNLTYEYFTYIREQGQYRSLRAPFSPKTIVDSSNGLLTVVARTVDCPGLNPQPQPTGATGGTGGTGTGG